MINSTSISYPLADFQNIYAISPDGWSVAQVCDHIKPYLERRLGWLQWRCKGQQPPVVELRALQRLCADYGTKFMINDDVLLAQDIDADGVHLGMSDQSISETRCLLGPKTIIGATCHANLTYAHQAVAAGANYVAFGSISPSTTKPKAAACPLSIITLAQQQLSVPIVAIGGIGWHDVPTVLAAGADVVAMSAQIFLVEKKISVIG